MTDKPITDAWLKEVGFKWHQFDRQPDRHWLLWIGNVIRARTGSMTDSEDLGIELAPAWWRGRTEVLCGRKNEWYCWLRSDTAHRYHRFIHIRHLKYQYEIEQLVTALTGQPWDPENHIYGSMQTPESAARTRAEWDRLDRRLMRDGHPWAAVEEDDSLGGALPEHLEAHEKQREIPEDGKK